MHLPPQSQTEIQKELKRLDKDKDVRLNKREYRELIHDLIMYTIEIL